MGAYDEALAKSLEAGNGKPLESLFTINLEKAHIKAHFRLNPKTGRREFIKDYDDARHKGEVVASFHQGDKVVVNNPKSKHHGKELVVSGYSEKYDCVRGKVAGEKYSVDAHADHLDHPDAVKTLKEKKPAVEDKPATAKREPAARSARRGRITFNSPADDIRAMPVAAYEKLYNKLEDENEHAKATVVLAKRMGDDADIKEAETLLVEQKKAGHLTTELMKRRYALITKFYKKKNGWTPEVDKSGKTVFTGQEKKQPGDSLEEQFPHIKAFFAQAKDAADLKKLRDQARSWSMDSSAADAGWTAAPIVHFSDDRAAELRNADKKAKAATTSVQTLRWKIGRRT